MEKQANEIDVNEAAQILGVNAETVRRYIKTGKLTPDRVGRRGLRVYYYFTKETVEQFKKNAGV